jgi:lipopolysaccharide export system protein LptA
MMTCSNLALYFGGSNQLDRMIATRNVVIEESTNSFKADRAVYTGSNHLLELTGNPSWRSGAREGRGELVEVSLQDEQMSVMTNAFLRLPASQLGESFVPAGLTNSPGKSPITRTARASPPAKQPKTPAATTNMAAPLFADISCDRYTLTTNSARFNGHVRVDHPQMIWVCDSLRLASSGEASNETRLLVAERGVDFHITNDGGQSVHGTCEKSVYDYKIVSGKTNSVMTLTGSPVLETDEGTITNKIILLDLVAHTIRAPGKYHLSGQAPAINTNVIGRLNQPTTSKKKK